MSKSDGILDVMGWRLSTKPRPQLYVGPSKDFVSDIFEPRLMALFDEAPKLSQLVARGKRNKKTRKIVNGVSVRLAWAGSATQLSSDQAGDVYIDEYDKMVGGMKGDADPFGLAKARADTYADRKIAVTSTPKRGTVETEKDPATGLEFWKMADPADIESPIWAKWQSGTRHHWAWRCPQCDSWFIPRVRHLKCDAGATATQARRRTWLEPPCGCVIEEDAKEAMNAGGAFIAPGMTIDDSGDLAGEADDNSNYSLWVSGLASPFLSWGERLEEIINAEAMGDSEARQGAQNKTGELWSPISGDVPDWQAIMNRREPYQPGTMPDAAIRLTLTVDVQANMLVCVTRAWGARAESWLVDQSELLGDTSQTPVWGMLAEKLTTPVDGFPISLCFVDSGFRPGKKFTIPLNRVYQFCRRFKGKVYATKGSSRPMLKPLSKSKADVNRKGEADKYGLELIRLDTDHWKTWVHERLTWPIEQSGAFHICAPDEEADGAGANESYCRQLVAEQRIISDAGKPIWIERSRQNHFLDAEAMAAAAGFMLNVHHIRRVPAREKVEEFETDDAMPEKPPVPGTPAAAVVAAKPKFNRFANIAAKLNSGRAPE